MNAIKTTWIILLATFALQVKSQQFVPTDMPHRQIGLGIGLQRRQMLDEQKSALVYSSHEYTAGIFFRNFGERSILSIDLNIGTGRFHAKNFGDRWLYTHTYEPDGSMTTDSFPVTSGILSGLLQIGYLREVGKETGMQWYVGPSLKNVLVVPENNIGLLNSLGMYATLFARKNFGNRVDLGAGLSIPLMAMNSRLPWHNTASDPIKPETITFFKKGTRFVTFNHFQSVQFSLNLGIQLTRRFNLGADYSFIWLRVPYYRPLKSTVNTVMIKTAYTF